MMKKITYKNSLALLVFTLFLFFAFGTSDQDSNNSNSEESSSQDNIPYSEKQSTKLVNQSKEAEVVQEIDLNANAVYVNKSMWSMTLGNYKKKRKFAKVVSSYIAYEKDNNTTIGCTIYDYETGKAIAEWGPVSGYNTE